VKRVKPNASGKNSRKRKSQDWKEKIVDQTNCMIFAEIDNYVA
jgi:hypothetical protein